LKQPVVEDNNFRDNVSAIYRYNDKEDVIAVFNNAGFNAKRHFEQFPQKIKEIDLTEGKLNENGDKGGKKDPFMIGLPFKLDDGTEYVNAMNPDDKTQYVFKTES
jgi:hypothetical protein